MGPGVSKNPTNPRHRNSRIGIYNVKGICLARLWNVLVIVLGSFKDSIGSDSMDNGTIWGGLNVVLRLSEVKNLPISEVLNIRRLFQGWLYTTLGLP